MTPHGIIENMARFDGMLGDRRASFFEPRLWDGARELMGRAVAFDFGVAVPTDAHQEFAQDLVSRGLFRLPFDVVLMTAQALPHTGILASCAGPGHPLVLFTIGPTRTSDGDIYDGVPLLTVSFGVDDGPDTMFRVNWKSVARDGSHMSRKTGKVWSEAEFEAASEKVVCFALGATAMLMSKEVETQVIPSPDRLNRQRARKGRPAVAERHIVRIRPEYRKAHADAVAASTGRASPRIHWRRGHFRDLGEGRVVPVAPAIVNAADGAKPLAKAYQMKA